MSEGMFEAKVSGKRESSSGIYLTLLINPADYNADLATLRVGSTLSMGWVESVNTTVEPIEIQTVIYGSGGDGADKPPAKDRKPFASLPLSQQAAMRTEDKDFQLFLEARGPIHDQESYADVVRAICGVESRANIKLGTQAGIAWMELEDKFQAYLTDRRYADVRK